MSYSKAFMWTTQEELSARVVDSLERLITLYATNSTKDSFRVPRPWDKNKQDAHNTRKYTKKNVREIIENTRWEAM